MFLKSAKRSPEICSQARNAAICAAATAGPETGSRSFERSISLSMKAAPAAWLDRVGAKKIFCSTAYPRSVGSPRCFARLGLSRCMMSSPPFGAVPTRINLRKIDGRSRTICCATIPPSENPRTSQILSPNASRKARACDAMPAIVFGTVPLDRPTPAFSNRITSRPAASGSVTAGSQLSSVPVKCCRHRSGSFDPEPKRRYAYCALPASINLVGAVMMLVVFSLDMYLRSSSALPLPADLLHCPGPVLDMIRGRQLAVFYREYINRHGLKAFAGRLRSEQFAYRSPARLTTHYDLIAKRLDVLNCPAQIRDHRPKRLECLGQLVAGKPIFIG